MKNFLKAFVAVATVLLLATPANADANRNILRVGAYRFVGEFCRTELHEFGVLVGGPSKRSRKAFVKIEAMLSEVIKEAIK